MNNALLIFEIILSVILILLVLIQAGDAGLSGVWTGGGETYHSKRGVEKIVFIATIVAAVLFGFIAILILVTSTPTASLDQSLDETGLNAITQTLPEATAASVSTTEPSVAVPDIVVE